MRDAVALYTPLSELRDLVARIGRNFDIWRLRRIMAGIDRALSRNDDEAAKRWLIRAEKALADIQADRTTFARKRASLHFG